MPTKAIMPLCVLTQIMGQRAIKYDKGGVNTVMATEFERELSIVFNWYHQNELVHLSADWEGHRRDLVPILRKLHSCFEHKKFLNNLQDKILGLLSGFIKMLNKQEHQVFGTLKPAPTQKYCSTISKWEALHQGMNKRIFIVSNNHLRKIRDLVHPVVAHSRVFSYEQLTNKQIKINETIHFIPKGYNLEKATDCLWRESPPTAPKI